MWLCAGTDKRRNWRFSDAEPDPPCSREEVTTIHLEVRVGNETAIRLYERMGFTGDGIRKAYYSDPVEDALLMTRHPE